MRALASDLGLSPGSATCYLCDRRQVSEPHFPDLENRNNEWLVGIKSLLHEAVGNP